MLASSRPYPNHTLIAEGPDRPAPLNATTRLLLFGGMLAPVIFVAAFVVQGVLQPGYDWLTDYVSDLTLTPVGWMQVASFIVCGWLLVGFALALCVVGESSRISPGMPGIFGMMGVGLIGAGAFEIDPSWAHLTVHGQLHYLSSFVIGGSMMLAGVLAWRDLHPRGRRKAAAACLLAGLTCLGLFSISLILPRADLPGLVERIALLIGGVWIAGFAVRVLRAAKRDSRYPHRHLGQPQPGRHEFERKALAA